jgi:type VI secretion system secreted protein Hcp
MDDVGTAVRAAPEGRRLQRLRPRQGWRTALLAVALAVAPLASAVAVDEIFLKLDQVEGESKDARHRGEIELLSFTQTGKGPPARGTTANTNTSARCPSMTLTKYVDVASLHMHKHMVMGKHYAKAVITFRRPEQPAVEYYRITLDEARVTEMEQSNTRLNFPSPAPPRTLEKVTLSGRRITMDYFMQQADGRLERRSTQWDCARVEAH